MGLNNLSFLIETSFVLFEVEAGLLNIIYVNSVCQIIVTVSQ